MVLKINNGFRLRLLPVEKALLIYVIVTGLFEIYFFSKLPGISINLLFRLFIIALTFLLSALNNPESERYNLKTVRIFLPFFLLGFFYMETDILNNLIFSQDLDPIIIGWENSIFGFQPSLSFADTFHYDLFAELMYMGYFSYYLISLGVPFYIYFKVSNKTGEKFGFIIVTSFLIFYIIFIIFPAGGPQFYYIDWPQKVPDGYIFGSIMRTIRQYGEGPTAAFPSAHVSICLILVFGSFLYAKNLFKIILPVAVALVVSTVYIRAHYLVDVMAGAFLAPILFWITAKIYGSVKPLSETTTGISEPVKRKLADVKGFKK